MESLRRLRRVTIADVALTAALIVRRSATPARTRGNSLHADIADTRGLRGQLQLDMKNTQELLHKELTALIIKGFFQVYDDLGYGYLESAYRNALPIALRDLGLRCEMEVPTPVKFRNVTVGEFRADLVVEKLIIVETKSVEKLHPAFERQVLNYLKATRLQVGLLLNFGPRAEFERYVLS